MLWLHLINGSASVGNEKAVFMMDWDDNAARHGTRPAVIPNSKVTDGFGVNTPLGHVRVRVIDTVEHKR